MEAELHESLSKRLANLPTLRREAVVVMDTSKLGIATAKAMDDLERLSASGDIPEDAEIGAVVVICALDAKVSDDHPDRENLRAISTQCFVFTEPEQLYVQLGLIEMARANYTPDLMGDE